jgi:hypothetical protein
VISQVKLAELHVKAFLSQQKRQDELNEQQCAHHTGNCGCTPETEQDDTWRQAAINCAGPLCIIDAIAQAEESWVELFEHAPRCKLPRSDEDSTPAQRRLVPRLA